MLPKQKEMDVKNWSYSKGRRHWRMQANFKVFDVFTCASFRPPPAPQVDSLMLTDANSFVKPQRRFPTSYYTSCFLLLLFFL